MKLQPTEKKTDNFSLQFHIIALCTTLIIISGLLLSWYSYTQLSKNMMNAGKDLFNVSSKLIVNKVESETNHIQTMLTILSASHLTQNNELQQKLAAIPMLTEMLKGTNSLSALFIAYDNHDFFAFRKLTSIKQLNEYDAPAKSAFMSTIRQHGKTQHYFYDLDKKLLKTVENGKFNFNISQRPWYARAIKNDHLTSTDAYVFYASDELGMTLSIYDKKNNAVIGADYTLHRLSKILKHFKLHSNEKRMIVDSNGFVIAAQNSDLLLSEDAKFSQLKTLKELQLEDAFNSIKSQKGSVIYPFNGQQWLGNVSLIAEKKELYLFQLVPTKELLADAYTVRYRSVFITIFIILAMLPCAWYFARLLTAPIRVLTRELDRINNFDFGTEIMTKTKIKEIDELIAITNTMKDTIANFQDLSSALISQHSVPLILSKIATECNNISNIIGTLIILPPTKKSENILCDMVGLSSAENKEMSLAIKQLTLSNHKLIAIEESQNKHQRNDLIPEPINKILTRHRSSNQPLYWRLIALKNHTGVNLGMLAVIETSQQSDQGKFKYATAIAEFSALAIQSQQLLAEQKHLLESFIHIIADAIDSKSPYTGSHCKRVPKLTKMICRAACQEKQGPYQDFQLDDNQWEEVHIATLLHDCGKIVTPEHIIDKATKLETIYNRINEIRMRFELLKSDAQTQYWKSLSEGGNPHLLLTQRDQLLAKLDEEFAFVANCNIGSEFMSDEKITTLQKIAQRVWTRTLDNRLGLAPQEANKIVQIPLPVQETLLTDKHEHLIERESAALTEPGNQWGFNMSTPEHKFNRGELYNLSVRRGTLTAEDRFVINEHVVHTIVMLSKLPFPEHLKDITTIAGGHHEKMDGTGYPRAIKASELPITARIMVVADIFEALTASDRPYKERKTLSESIKIMSFMVKDNHIDPNVFQLFLTSGTYLEYAKKYLLAEQIDQVDISQYI